MSSNLFIMLIITGIKDGCKMKCDEIPCKNQGVCIEDFEKSENTCNCEHTSYFGDTCAEGMFFYINIATNILIYIYLKQSLGFTN